MNARILFIAVSALLALLAVWSLLDQPAAQTGALGVERSNPQGTAGSQDDAESSPQVIDLAPVTDADRAEVERAMEPPVPVARESEAAAPPTTPEGEEIQGRVVFTSGVPFPGISVEGTASGAAASPGLRKADIKTDANGDFILRQLAPGPFEMHVIGGSYLPVVGNDVLQSGTSDNVLAVNALLLHVFCVDASGDAVGLRSFTHAFLPDEHAEGENEGSTSMGWSQDQASVTLAVPAERSYMLEGGDGQGGVYYAYLRGDLQPGVHRVELRKNAPGLGAVKLTVASGPLEAKARLRLRSIERDGESVDNTQLVSDDPERGLTIEVRGLLPGHYEVRPELQASPWTALAEASHSIKVLAGTEHEILLKTLIGGRIDLKVSRLGAPAEGETVPRGKVRLRRVGETDWEWARLVTKHKRSTVRGSSVWLDGRVASSAVLAPGAYRIQVEADGYTSAEAEVIVQTGVATEALVTMARE